MSIVSDFKDINRRLRGDDWWEPADVSAVMVKAMDDSIVKDQLRELNRGFEVRPEWVLKAADYPIVDSKVEAPAPVVGWAASYYVSTDSIQARRIGTHPEAQASWRKAEADGLCILVPEDLGVAIDALPFGLPCGSHPTPKTISDLRARLAEYQAALASVDTGPGGCANAIAEAEAANLKWAERARADGVRTMEEAYRQDVLGVDRAAPGSERTVVTVWWRSQLTGSQAAFSIGFDPNALDPAGDWVVEACLNQNGPAVRIHLPNDFLGRMEKAAEAAARPCTCHPSMVPCQRRYAYSECREAAEKAALADGLHSLRDDEA